MEKHILVMESSRRRVHRTFTIDVLSERLRDLTTMEDFMDKNLESFLKELKSGMDKMGYDWNGVWRSLIVEEDIKGMEFVEVIERLNHMMDNSSKGRARYIILYIVSRTLYQ